MVIKILENEYWWGGAIDFGCEMPYDAQTKCLADFVTGGTYPDQCSSLFLSSKGRIIHSDKPFKAEFNSGNIIIDDKYKIDFSEGFENLRGAHKEAAKRYFNLCGKIPDEKFFKVPQYNTWIELMYNQNEKQILEYAHSIVDNKMTRAGLRTMAFLTFIPEDFKIRKRWLMNFTVSDLRLCFG